MAQILVVSLCSSSCNHTLSDIMKSYDSQQNTGWVGFIRVDGTPYTWLGAAPSAKVVDQTDFSYTSTRSTFVLSAGGKVVLNVTFLSPVNANDLRRQSLPFSYLDVGVHSLDGASHDVQLYADVSAGRFCLTPRGTCAMSKG